MLKAISLFILVLITNLNSFAQTEELERRFFFGVNVGVKFANKNYAQRYGGWYQDQLPNTIYQVNNYNTIYEILGQKDFLLAYDWYPFNIRYNPGLLTGVTMGYKISPTIQAGIDADFSKLKVRDVYTIEVIDPSVSVSEEQIRLGDIYAEESRFNGRFNLDYIVDGDPVNFIFGASGVFSAWRVDKHIAFFQDHQMPLHSVHNPNNNLVTKTSGIGWGFGLNAGLEYRFSEKIVAQLMYQPYMIRVDYFNTKNTIQALGSDYVKDKFRLEHDITVRVLWK